ncbi:MAG: hypothetical protein K2M89_07155 [Clostridiales bacterium]|nr:hypothetical protein [Clostridiales bacterium]
MSQIVLSGKYNKTYSVLSYFITLRDETVLVDGDRLFICLFSEIAVVDLVEDKIVNVIKYECWQLFGIYKFKNGYFVRGEGSNMFLNRNLDCVWEIGCIDIFANPKAENEFEIHDDYIAVYDWYGSRHFYNETGEFKTEYHPEYDMSKNSLDG